MAYNIALQEQQLPCQEVAFKPIVDEIRRRSDVRLWERNKGFAETAPDIVLVQGDTWETLHSAYRWVETKVPIAHMYGGDITEGGWIDDKIRWAVSQMADYHFPSTTESARRLASTGIEPATIFLMGDPVFDVINARRDSEEVLKRLGITEPFGLIHIHDDKKWHQEKTERLIKEAREPLGLKYWVTTDAGKRLTHHDWLALMEKATLMITNSSCGVAEAPSFNLPVVLVGNRQQNRENAGNTIQATYDKTDIIKKGLKAIKWKESNKTWDNPYDVYKDTKNSMRIVDSIVAILEGI